MVASFSSRSDSGGQLVSEILINFATGRLESVKTTSRPLSMISKSDFNCRARSLTSISYITLTSTILSVAIMKPFFIFRKIKFRYDRIERISDDQSANSIARINPKSHLRVRANMDSLARLDIPPPDLLISLFAGLQARSSGVEHYLDTVGVSGSNPLEPILVFLPDGRPSVSSTSAPEELSIMRREFRNTRTK